MNLRNKENVNHNTLNEEEVNQMFKNYKRVKLWFYSLIFLFFYCDSYSKIETIKFGKTLEL